jgi:hypothetical protein
MDAGKRKSACAGSDGSDRVFAINDKKFCTYVARLKRLQYFLFEEAVPVNASNAPAIGMADFSVLQYDPDGRAPTIAEWSAAESQTQVLFLHLTPAMKRKFLMSETPWSVAWLPALFLIFSSLSLFGAVASLALLPDFSLFFFYLMWVASLGAIGAIAYIGMNVLSIQDDITFDLTNMRLFSLRIALGSLFAVVLTVPVGYTDFYDWCVYVLNSKNPSVSAVGTTTGLTRQTILLLLPFVLGFSTSVVIVILSQLMDGIQVFFGRRPSSTAVAFSSPTKKATNNPKASNVRRPALSGTATTSERNADETSVG